MPNIETVRRWILGDDEFRVQYARARTVQAETYAEEIVEIADDSERDVTIDANGVPMVNSEVVARSKLRVDARKWVASKLLPKKYGERQIIEQEGEVRHYVMFGVKESQDAVTWEQQNSLS